MSSTLRPFQSSLFSLCVFVSASCTQGCGCVLKASLRSHQGGSLLFNTQTMTCTFSLAWLDGPVRVSVSANQMEYFLKGIFFPLNAELWENTGFTHDYSSSLCYHTWFYQVQLLPLHLWLWMIHDIPCRSVQAACIIWNKYWWIVSFGISF